MNNADKHPGERERNETDWNGRKKKGEAGVFKGEKKITVERDFIDKGRTEREEKEGRKAAVLFLEVDK